MSRLRIVYLVPDLTDTAAQKRVRMFEQGGATVTLLGFRRSKSQQANTARNIIELGVTQDAKLASRAVSVAKTMSQLYRYRLAFENVDVIVARNLEMLAIAKRAYRLYAPYACLVYECLDIHRILISSKLPGRVLRMIEKNLWRDVDLLLTSSPAFVRNHFEPNGFDAPIRIIENKIFDDRLEHIGSRVERNTNGPWRIGLFGMLRCRQSIDILGQLAQRFPGRIEVILRGKPSPAVFPDFDEVLQKYQGVHYFGPYQNPDDIQNIYRDVHFNWAIDYYEAGKNSAWLLPNRIYEGCLYGAIPLALSETETSHWLRDRNAGVVLPDPPLEALSSFFQTLDHKRFADLTASVNDIPLADLVNDNTSCRSLVKALTLKKTTSRPRLLSSERISLR